MSAAPLAFIVEIPGCHTQAHVKGSCWRVSSTNQRTDAMLQGSVPEEGALDRPIPLCPALNGTICIPKPGFGPSRSNSSPEIQHHGPLESSLLTLDRLLGILSTRHKGFSRDRSKAVAPLPLKSPLHLLQTPPPPAAHPSAGPAHWREGCAAGKYNLRCTHRFPPEAYRTGPLSSKHPEPASVHGINQKGLFRRGT